MTQENKLRIGLLVDGMELPAWAYRMIAIIKESDYAEIALVVQSVLSADGRPGNTPNRGADDGALTQFWKATIRRILLVIERFLVGKPGNLPDAFEILNGTELLTGIEVIQLTARRHQGRDQIEPGALASIQGHDIDVFVQLGSRNLNSDMLRSARCGIWYCDHGNPRVNRGGPAGYWEVMESWREIGSTLRIVAEDYEGVAYRSFSATIVMSMADTKSNVYWKTLNFIPRKLNQLRREGRAIFFARLKEENNSLEVYDRRLYAAPTNVELSVLVWKKLLQKVRSKWEDIMYYKQWALLYDIHHDISLSFCSFKRIIPPPDRLWADPFIVARDGKYYIFFEELFFAKPRGHISLIVLNRDGSYEPAVPILKTAYHLSYPFIFEFEGNLYLIPESCENRTVELYKCVAFPLKWEYQKNLMEGCLMVDATLYRWNGKWWMFGNRMESDGASTSDELFLYYSDSPLSDNWIPHKRNPVVSDVKSARPAGRLFLRDGRLFRPSQDSSGHYGYGFNICEITKLTETDYDEEIVEKVEPKWDKNVVATHTINYEDGLTIIDAQIRHRM